MKRVCLSLLFSFFFLQYGVSQNLIPNPSVEDYIECPEHLGGLPSEGNGIFRYVPPWKSLRGTPDYFNACAPEGLGWNNDLGYQEPRTGDGYLGAIMYSPNLPNSKEYIGVELYEPLIVGQSYFVSFHVSMALDQPASKACDRIGFVLMTDNYLLSGSQAPTPNHATYYTQEIIEDTLDWINISTEITADSAYTMIAFGVFFNADSLNVTAPYGGDPSTVAYYFLDDFCVASDSEDCDLISTTIFDRQDNYFRLFPNPSGGLINLLSESPMCRYEILDGRGRIVKSGFFRSSYSEHLELSDLSGIYILKVHTKKGVVIRRVFIKTT